MKPKKTVIFIILLIHCVLLVQAQRKTVIGKVSRSSDSSAIAGVTVESPKGEKVATNAYGLYIIEVDDNAISLTFSFTEMEPQTVNIGDNDIINIFLEKEGVVNKEIVTTAFGIKQDKKALGYSVQELSGSELSLILDDNFINSLSGKVAGVQTISSSGGIGASARVTIRGCNSFTGSNQPLFVLDGIPIDNRTNHILNAGGGGVYGVDYGNSASDVNMLDIESVSILKGANAAALYGSRAANGVIILNTKSGRNFANRFGVSYCTTMSFEKPFRLFSFQNKYGQGSNQEFSFVDGKGGGINDGVDESWGPLLDGQDRAQFFGVGPWQAYPDNYKDMFETGTTFSNNVSFSSDRDNRTMYLSLSNITKNGIVPNTYSNKNSIFLKSSLAIGRMSVSGSINYFRDKSNRMANGDNVDNIVDQFLWSARQVDYTLLKNHYTKPDGTQYNWNYNYHDNPYWTLYKKASEQSRDRVIGNVNVIYTFTNFTVSSRIGSDFYNELRERKWPIYTILRPEGQYYKENTFVNENNADILVSTQKKLFTNSLISFNAGANYMNQKSRNSSVLATALLEPDVFAIGNSKGTPEAYEYYSSQTTNSVFAFAKYSCNELLFIDLTMRNDWSSTLPKSNRSFFYPSVSASLLLSEFAFFSNRYVSYAKLRVGWASVGNSAGPYQLQSIMNSSTPYGDNPYFLVSNEIPPSNLKPENTKSLETGFDLNFFKNRIETEFTYYQSNTNNHILGIAVSAASGFNTQRINAGMIENKGVEFICKATPIQTKDFTWQIIGNYAKNKNTVVELTGSIKSLKLGEFKNVTLEAQPGQPYGVLVGNSFVRDANGKMVVNAKGLPKINSVTKIIGNIMPDWIGGLTNKFTYKAFTASILIDIRVGGDIYSYSHRVGIFTGGLEETLPGREDGLIVDGVKEDGSPNDIRVTAQSYYKSLKTIHESDLFDASFVKLREAYLSYNIPEKWSQKAHLSKVVVSFTGRNLWLIHSNIPHIDPETEYGTENAVQGFEYAQMPSLRSFGVQIRVDF